MLFDSPVIESPPPSQAREFTVHVLPSPVMTEAVERRYVVLHTNVGSKSGEEVVSKSARRVEWVRRSSHLYLVGLYKEDSLMISLVLP